MLNKLFRLTIKNFLKWTIDINRDNSKQRLCWINSNPKNPIYNGFKKEFQLNYHKECNNNTELHFLNIRYFEIYFLYQKC